MVDETLLTLTADIASAHVSHNTIPANAVPALIQSVYAALASLGQPTQVTEEKREPAVSIRASVKPDAITCLECGAKLKMLKRHLDSDHGLTPAEYRARWKLASDYPMVAPEYAAKRKALAVKIGLGRKPKQPAKTEAKTVPAPKPRRRKAKTPSADAD